MIARHKIQLIARRAGAGTFLFFLAKGLLWLAIPSLIALWGSGS